MQHQYEIQEMEASYVPLSSVEVSDNEGIELVEKCLDDMENLADVVKIHCNAVIASE
jgi:transcriptional/translational regulatory protein YebC/TACO1